MITPLILVFICHCVNLPQYYRLYAPSPFHPSHSSSPLATIPLVSVSMSLFLSCLFICFVILDSTYKQIGAAPMEKSMKIPQKVKIDLSCGPAVSVRG